ncbi:hypothetical protein [Parabacteroides sp. AM08-6]|uniref:hypothetical protein n=1 Tax=Parabacteroides sp. AM08-6 TaxID=2292053 RepID=UPI003519E0BA
MTPDTKFLIAFIGNHLTGDTKPVQCLCKIPSHILIIFVHTFNLFKEVVFDIGTGNPVCHFPDKAFLNLFSGHFAFFFLNPVHCMKQCILVSQTGAILGVFPVGNVVVIIIKTAVYTGVTPRLTGGGQDFFCAVARRNR